MKVSDTDLKGVVIIEPQSHGDERGFFLETFHLNRYQDALGIPLSFVQDNHSRSRYGVLRGIHAQRLHPQGKLVRVSRGEVFDVAVDINKQSPTYGKWVGVSLSDKNAKQLWIPPGYGHGFVVLSETADFEYKCTEYYHPEDEIGVIWNDSALDIQWPVVDPTVSAKDLALPTLANMQG